MSPMLDLAMFIVLASSVLVAVTAAATAYVCSRRPREPRQPSREPRSLAARLYEEITD